MKKLSTLLVIIFCVTTLGACTKDGQTTNNKISQDSLDVEVEKENMTDAEELGSAKAIEKESDLWNFFDDEEVGLSLNYPYEVNYKDQSGHDLTLDIEYEKISDLEGALGYDKETAMNNQVALANASYGEVVDWPLEISKKTKQVGDTFGQDFVVLSRFEVCNKTFERLFYFFHNGYQVTIKLSADTEKMIEENNIYFTSDPTNCADELFWDFEKQNLFYQKTIKANNLSLSSKWLKIFDQIIDSIFLYDVQELQSNSKLIIGEWVSVDDAKNKITFLNEKKIDIYDNNNILESDYSFNDAEDMLRVVNVDGNYEYKILEVSKDRLVLSFLPRGNTLEYTRITKELY